LRILIVTEFLYDDPTPVSAIGGLARAYASLGHRVLVVGQQTPGAQSPDAAAAPWGELRLLGGRGSRRWARAVSVFRGMRRALREFRPDLVHFHALRCFGANQLTALWLPCALSGARVGLTFHSWDRVTGAEAPGRKPWRLLRAALRRAAWITAIADCVVDDMRRTLGAAAPGVSVVPCGWEPAERDAPAREAPVDAGSRPFVLCVARLAVYKGIDLLLLAWRDVAERFPGVDLVFCGGDHYDGYFQGLASRLGLDSRVRFVGVQARERVWELLRRCELFVLPSRYEIFGIAALEAQACGKAVLASDVGGLGRLVRDGETGLLTRPKSVPDLAAGLARLLEDPALRARLGEAGRERAAAFTWEKIARRYLELDAAA
jgi:glycosyltransferase involved in cell wall biosynthesis